MQTKFVSLEVSLIAPSDQMRSAIKGSELLRSDALRSHIETQLTQHGDPLRWAITSINTANKTAQVEAVVTTISI